MKLGTVMGNHKFIFLLPFFVFVFVLIVINHDYLQTKELQDELTEFITPQITIAEKVYTVTGGVVFQNDKTVFYPKNKMILRIARYSILNRIDPIFSLEGVDPETLEKALVSLESSREDLISLYSPEEQEMLKKALFPNYLHTLPKLEQKRRELIFSPSKKIIEEYNALLKKTLSVYISDIQQLKDIHQEFSNDEGIGRIIFNFIGGYSTAEGFAKALAELEQSALIREREIVSRSGCFRKTELCPLSLSTNSLKVDPPLEQKPGTLSREMQTVKSILLAYHSRTHDINNGASKEPSIMLRDSSCTYTTEQPAYHIFWRMTNEGNRGLQMESLDDLYFFDTRKFDVVYGPYLTNLKESGVDLFYQTQMNEYMCPDLGKDITRASTLFAIRSSLKKTPLFSKNSPALNSARELKRLETEIVSGDLVRESTVRSYMSEISSLLLEYGESGLGKIIGNENVLNIEKILSLFNQNSAYYSEILFHIVWTDRNAFNKMSQRGGITPPEELLISRGYPQIFFLGSNKTVVTGPEPSFIYRNPNNNAALEGLRFATYNKNLQHIFSPEEIINLIVENYELKREMALPRKI